MNISATVGILILTVFLLLSTPVYAGNDAPPPYKIYMAYGYVEYTDETPAADDESVTLYRAEDPSTTITVPLSSHPAAGWWKVNLYKIPGLTNECSVVAEVRDQNTIGIVDTSSEGIKKLLDFDALTVTPPAPETSPATNGDSSSTGSSNSNTGSTYPPTLTATPTPTAAPDPTTVAPTDTPTTVAPTEEPTKAPTAATEIEGTEEFNTTPGFGAVLTVFAIAGLLVATYLVMRRRE